MMFAFGRRTIIVLQGLMLLLCIRKGTSQECAANGVCDSHERCRAWKDDGECYRSPDYMKRVCPVSCIDMKQSPPREECKDIHEHCIIWFDDAECETNDSVKKYCPRSCGMCQDTGTTSGAELCKDNHENCSGWADMGECEKNPNYMLANCMKSCGKCKRESKYHKEDFGKILERTAKFGPIQRVEGSRKKEAMEIVKSMLEYMENNDDFLSLPQDIKDNCRNANELCSFWAAIGECEKNLSFMTVQCAPACQSCHFIDAETRCPKLPDAIPALKPGDLNSIFQRIVETAPGNRTLTDEDRRQLAMSEMPEYSVTVHSRPSNHPLTEIDIDQDRELPPWIITLDNFLTEEECDSIIQHGYETGFNRSEVDAEDRVKFDGTHVGSASRGRTSENAWCSSRNGCREKTVPKRILDRIATILGIPVENSEDLQILKYEVGQFYKTHHDYIPTHKDRQCGPRILTFFLYLSDVEAGGETDFPTLGIKATPKKGRAVLWPSVYSSDPIDRDLRTRHQALPVDAGVKFAANAWIHMFDYQAPQRIGCT